MKGFFNLFKLSSKEFFSGGVGNSVLNLVICAMLIALSTVIEFLSIDIGTSKINFAFLAIAAIGMLFGPTVGFFSGGICDIMGFLVKPTGAFLPIYTLIGAFQGLLYGLVLYRRWGNVYSDKAEGRIFGLNLSQLSIRLIAARLIDVLVINMVINTYANIHYGFIPSQSLSTIISLRAVKNFTELLADLPLLLTTMPIILATYQRTIGRSQRSTNLL